MSTRDENAPVPPLPGLALYRDTINWKDREHAAIWVREKPYEAHGWGYGPTPEAAELVARSRWDALEASPEEGTDGS